MAEEKWLDVGPVEELRQRAVNPVRAGTTPIARLRRGSLARPVRREPGSVRVAGISTTVMDRVVSEHTLERVARGGRKAHALVANENE